MRTTRTDSIETVVKVGEVNDAEGSNYAVVIKRVVYQKDKEVPPAMIVDVYNCCSDGSYDEDNDRVIKMRGVDTLELQFLLKELKDMVVALTGVRGNF